MGSIATFDDLLDLARQFEDQPIQTVTGRLFTVRVFNDRELAFTPVSSGIGQTEGRKAQERFLARYLATGSIRPGDYADVSHNASYLIGLLVAAGDAATR